ncbi:MAG: polysaccharide biosynthesis C-terminal domain-containing protein [Bacteroidota bacterium]
MGIVKRQGILNSIITYAGIVIGFVSLLIVQPHFLTKEEIGLTRVLFSFSALIATFMPFGMNGITLKYFPYFRDRDKGHYGFFGFMLLVPLLGFLIVAIIMWSVKSLIISQYIGQSKLFTDYFFYAFPMTLFLAFISVLNAYSYSLFKTSFPTLLNDVMVRLVSILLFTIYHIKVIDRDQFVFLFCSIYGLQVIVLLIYIFIVDKPKMKVDKAFLKEQNPKAMFVYGLVISLAALSSLGLKYLDVVMLGKFVPLSLVGIYAISAFIPTVIEAPLSALEKIALTTIAQARSNNNMNDIREIYFKSSKYLLLIGGILFLGINLNIDSLFKLMPDKDFALGKYVVLIISTGTLVNMATGTNDSIIYTSEKYVYGTYMLFVLFVMAIINNLIFIPRYGIEGAAFATALSALIYNSMKFIFIWRSFHLQPFDRKTLLIIFNIIFCWTIVFFIPHLENAVVDIIFRSIIITFVFGMITYVLKIVPEFHKYIPLMKRK